MPADKKQPTRDDLLREIARLKGELEAARRTDRQLIDDVLTTIQDGISISDPDLTVRHVNPVMKEWYRENLPLEGKKCYQVYHNRESPCSSCPVLRCFKSGRTEVEIVPGLPGSPAEWIELFAYPIQDPATGEISGVVEFVRDITERKRVEDEFRTEHAQLLSIFDSIDQAIYVADPDTYEILFANRALKTRIGHPVIGKTCYREFQGLDQPCDFCTNEIIRKLDGQPYYWEHHNPKIDRDYQIIDRVIKWPDGRDVRFELAIDITDRKTAEEELELTKQTYLDIFNTLTEAIYIHEATGPFIQVNKGAVEMYGYSREELIGQSPQTVAAPGRNDLEKIGGILAEVTRTGKPARLDFWGRRKNGEVFPKEVIVNRGKYFGKDVLIVTARDITDRKRAETSLRESAKRYRELSNLLETIFNTIPDILGIQDPDRGIIRYNEAGCRILGVKPEETAGKKCYQLLGREEPCPVCATTEVLRTGKPARVEKFVEEMELWFDCRAYPVLDGEGKVVQVIEHLRDITVRRRLEEERRELERQVQQAQKLESLGVLAGGIAHDFNNILMVVLGNAELALETIPTYSPARMNLEQVTRAVRQAADLCRQMFAYTGKSSFTRRPVDLKSLVEEIAHLLQTSISKKAVLNLQFDDHLPPIEADPSQVRQVVMNLLINASEALDGKSGYITLSAGAALCGEEELKRTEFPEGLEPGLYVFFEVADTGTGMDEKTRRRLFEPFFSTKFTGRGLGLAAVLGIVRGHNGAIRIDSEPGKGTTFRVLFPALDPGKAGPAVPAASASGGLDWRGEGTVLLAEDEETLRALGTQILQRLGLEVIIAADGREAVELFRKHRKKIDLVLLDLTMPRLDGGEALAEIRKIDPSARVVIASGYSEADLAERFAGRNLTGILQKPYSLGRLRGLLSRLLSVREESEGPGSEKPPPPKAAR